jgi:hypothetical protein
VFASEWNEACKDPKEYWDFFNDMMRLGEDVKVE